MIGYIHQQKINKIQRKKQLEEFELQEKTKQQENMQQVEPKKDICQKLENIISVVTPKILSNPSSQPSANNISNKSKAIFPENWYISISFGYSRSENFPQAVGLARMAPQYIENDIDGQLMYQAIYSSKPDEYLMFIKLYELVSQWKSCYVIINGTIVDRKIVQGLNYCYGDKCRNGNKDFCYGASYMTQNPFVCHRLQISSYNNPLYEFYTHTKFNTYQLDKNNLVNKIMSKSTIYSFCPCFDLQKTLKVVEKLPIHISQHQYQKLVKMCYDDRIKKYIKI